MYCVANGWQGPKFASEMSRYETKLLQALLYSNYNELLRALTRKCVTSEDKTPDPDGPHGSPRQLIFGGKGSEVVNERVTKVISKTR
jgi:hypothetical protein